MTITLSSNYLVISGFCFKGELSADQVESQQVLGALKEAEEEVVELHGQYFAHRDKMDRILIPLYQMTNEIDYDVDGTYTGY